MGLKVTISGVKRYVICYVMWHNVAHFHTSLIVKAPNSLLQICSIMSSHDVAVYRPS